MGKATQTDCSKNIKKGKQEEEEWKLFVSGTFQKSFKHQIILLLQVYTFSTTGDLL